MFAKWPCVEDELVFLNLKQASVVTHLVTCVRTPPRTVEKIAPIGAPAENVANAIEREGPGGNALARIPSW